MFEGLRISIIRCTNDPHTLWIPKLLIHTVHRKQKTSESYGLQKTTNFGTYDLQKTLFNLLDLFGSDRYNFQRFCFFGAVR